MLNLFSLNYLQWPEFPANFPALGNFNINPSFFRKFDYSNAAVLDQLPKFVLFHFQDHLLVFILIFLTNLLYYGAYLISG